MRFFRVTVCRSRFLVPALLTMTLLVPVLSSQTSDVSGNPKAQQAFDKAKQYQTAHQYFAAIDAYKKANKIADGKCVQCLMRLCDLYRDTGDNRHSAEAAAQLEQIVTSPADKASAAILQGAALLREGTKNNKHTLFEQADEQFKRALQFQPGRTEALFYDGLALGRSGNDAAAKDAFARFVAAKQTDPVMEARARRYMADPQLIREKMAPPFSLRTSQGTVLSLDSLQGKVVLLDFWATWCGPCNAELPHVQQIAKRFQGQPLIVVSISVDHDRAKWQKFVEEHGMDWPQYWDKSGDMAATFGVHAIPHYFTIDTDGVLRSEDMGSEANIDGRLKKLVAQAQKVEAKPVGTSATVGQ